MDLRDFVKQTLSDITNAVSEAQDKSKLYIAPGFVENVKITEPQFVDFEVHVTSSKEGGGGIKLWSFGEAKATTSAETGHKISFKVPVFFQAPTPLSKKHFSNKKKTKTESSGGGGGWDPDGKHIIAESPFD